jgi:hypothetical protein
VQLSRAAGARVHKPAIYRYPIPQSLDPAMGGDSLLI